MKEEWNLGYTDKYGVHIKYDKTWFCNENKTIHPNEKQFLQCSFCNF